VKSFPTLFFLILFAFALTARAQSSKVDQDSFKIKNQFAVTAHGGFIVPKYSGGDVLTFSALGLEFSPRADFTYGLTFTRGSFKKEVNSFGIISTDPNTFSYFMSYWSMSPSAKFNFWRRNGSRIYVGASFQYFEYTASTNWISSRPGSAGSSDFSYNTVLQFGGLDQIAENIGIGGEVGVGFPFKNELASWFNVRMGIVVPLPLR